jgi:hypothetical protein
VVVAVSTNTSAQEIVQPSNIFVQRKKKMARALLQNKSEGSALYACLYLNSEF